MLRFTAESESAYCLQRIVNQSTVHFSSLLRGAPSVLCAFFRYRHQIWFFKEISKVLLWSFHLPLSPVPLLLKMISDHFVVVCFLQQFFRRLFFFIMIRRCTHRSIWGWQGLILLAHHFSGMLLQYLNRKVREMLTFAAAGLPSTPKDQSLESVRLRS